MEQTKNLCAQIPMDLHAKVCVEKDASGMTMSQYITQVLTKYYENGGITMEKSRTMAFQISEELYQRIKEYLAQESARTGVKLTQRDFVLTLIEQALSNSN